MTVRWSDQVQLRIWWAEVEAGSMMSRNALNELVAKNVFGRTLADDEARVRPFEGIVKGSRPHSMNAIVDYVATLPGLAYTAWLFQHPFWNLLRKRLHVRELSAGIEIELRRLGLRRENIGERFELEVSISNKRFQSMYLDALSKNLYPLDVKARVMLLAMLCAEAAFASATEVVEPAKQSLDYSLENTFFGRSLWNNNLALYEDILLSCQAPQLLSIDLEQVTALWYRAHSLIVPADT